MVVKTYCVCKLSNVLLSVMRVIMPWISSNPFDLVSEEGSRQPSMYRHLLTECNLGDADDDERGDVATM